MSTPDYSAENEDFSALEILPEVIVDTSSDEAKPEMRTKKGPTIVNYMEVTAKRNASDLYLTSNSTAMLRVEGNMVPLGSEVLSADRVEELITEILDSQQMEIFRKKKELDLAVEISGVGRFRINVFYQRNTQALCMRYVKSQIPDLDELRLPKVLKDLVMMKRGLILMVGATGSGKSTTLAAMIKHRNAMESGHILTIEDPIEFVHPNNKCIINQREVGQDTESYDRALVSSLREAPDVVLIGEIRKKDTMDASLQLANTGHLSISTLHANNAYQALQRIINMYPEEGRDQMYLDISLTLRAIISQRLVKGIDGKRMAAVEVMINTPLIQEMIATRKIGDIREAMANSTDKSVQTFDDSLLRLYKAGMIEKDEALSNADSSANLDQKINFGG